MKRILTITAILTLTLISMVRAEESALQKADQLAGAKKYEEALAVLHDYEKSHPTEIEVHDRIQRLLKRQNKQQEALAEYKDRYEKDPSALNGYLYVRLLESPVERENRYKEIIAKNPGFVWGHVGLATALMDQDHLQDGIDAADQGLKQVSEPAELHYIKARIYRRMQDYPAMASEAREYYRLHPDDESREVAFFYGWLEVSHSKPEDQLKLADAWVSTYRKDLEDGAGLDGAAQLAEASYLYAEKDQQPARVRKFAELGLKALAAEKPPARGEDRDYYMRIKGSLLSLNAWAEARSGSSSRAESLLKAAAKTGFASETFYFSARTQVLLHKEQDALRNALRAATYPPVYKGSKDLAESLWKTHGGGNFEQALHDQREYFAPERKKRVLSQQVAEKFKPFQIADAQGQIISDKDLTGKVILINFWAVWCPPCREELPHWNEFVAKHASDQRILMFAVGDEPWETIHNYMKNHSYSFPVFRDEKYWEQFDVSGIPTLLIIDPKGTIRFRNSGFEEGMEYEETLLWQINAAKSF